MTHTQPLAPVTETAPEQSPERLSLTVRIINLVGVLLPFAGLVTAIVLLWGPGFSWVHLGLLLGMYIPTGFGVTIGFHRLFTHRAFEAPRAVQAVLAVLGSMAVQGPLLKWVATHRLHHQYSDHEHDPHSPHGHGGGVIGVLRGLWHAHMGWIFMPDAPTFWRYVPDLAADRLVRVLSSMFTVWVAVGLIFPALLGGLLTLSWTGALLGFIWGGLVRIFFFGHHVTWSINSVCHLWGTQPFRSHDHTTTIMHSRRRRGLGCAGGRSTAVTGSSAAWSCWDWPETCVSRRRKRSPRNGMPERGPVWRVARWRALDIRPHRR